MMVVVKTVVCDTDTTQNHGRNISCRVLHWANNGFGTVILSMLSCKLTFSVLL